MGEKGAVRINWGIKYTCEGVGLWHQRRQWERQQEKSESTERRFITGNGVKNQQVGDSYQNQNAPFGATEQEILKTPANAENVIKNSDLKSKKWPFQIPRRNNDRSSTGREMSSPLICWIEELILCPSF